MKTRHVIIAGVVLFIGLDVLVLGALWLLRSDAKSEPNPRRDGKVLLTAPEGKHFVGHQLQFLTADPDGVLHATNTTSIHLYHTEGKSFRLTGKLWLDEPENRPRVQDLPDGFALFFREWDGMHRYSITTRSMEVKRRLNAGVRESGIRQVTAFDPPTFRTWIPFTAEASADAISFQLGDQSGVISGPLDTDYANRIVLAPGTRLSELRLEINPRGQ